MRIGLNLLYLLPDIVGGTETYAKGLLTGLSQIVQSEEVVVFVNQSAAEWPIPDLPTFHRVVCPVLGTNQAKRYLYEQCAFPRLLRKHSVDVVHSLGYVAPLFPGCPSVVTIPDLNFHVPEIAMSFIKRRALRLFVQLAARCATAIIAISEYGREEILKAFHLPQHKVIRVHLAPSPTVLAEVDEDARSPEEYSLQVPSPFLLAFSSQSPHKNLTRLLEGFALGRHKFGLSHSLVIVGHPPVTGASPQFIRDLGVAPFVQFTGYLSIPAIRSVLSQADCLVFPSLYEGFGLPVLEAMEVGLPVVCSHRASLPEVAGEAAIYFDPLSVEDIAEKISLTAASPDLQAQLRLLGKTNLLRFSWEKTARETMAVYQQVASH